MPRFLDDRLSPCLMMVAGERSGDVYGGELATALAPRLPGFSFFGCGGTEMRAAGVETIVDAHQFAMVGITEVASGLPRAWRALRTLMKEVDRRRPQAAILIDSPSLNLRLAKRLKRRGVAVIYFVSPQLWAWKKWRLRHVKQRVDKMLCLFAFEEALYRQAGVCVEYVGHPLVDLVEKRRRQTYATRQEFFRRFELGAEVPTVALLPGSRAIEVAYNLPVMLASAERLASRRPVQFILAIAPALDAARIQSELTRLASRNGRVAVRAVTGATLESLEFSDVAVVASGTATLEAALVECPMVVVYRVAPVTAFLARFMVDVPFYSMVNLLAEKRVVPELIQEGFTPSAVAAEIERLLDCPSARQEMVCELRSLRSRLGTSGAIERAATAVANFVSVARISPVGNRLVRSHGSG
jgi:lipid-A-disaccharide synthase